MGTWRANRCPRCEGRLFVDIDEDGWHEQCINCAYRHELRAAMEFAKVTAVRDVNKKVETIRTAH